MIRYSDSTQGVVPAMLKGFFVGWPNPPSPETHLRLLENSDHVMLAVDDEAGLVVGFATAVSDNTLSAYITFLEVLPEYQRRGIGPKLIRQLMNKLEGIYMVDTICDPEVAPFYEKLGMVQGVGMMLRRYEFQSGKGPNPL